MRFLIILIYISLSHAEASPFKLTRPQCSDIDIRADKNEAVKKYLSTPSDQGSMGWCYGYVTADLLTVVAEAPLSVSHISSIYNKSIRSSPSLTKEYDSELDSSSLGIYQKGYINRAVEMAVKYSPVCMSSDLDQNLSWLKEIDRVHSEYQRNQITKKETCETIHSYLPRLEESLSDFMMKYITKNINDDLEPMIRQNCTRKIKIPKTQAKFMNKPKTWGRNKYINKINDLLNSGKPLGIDYKLENISIERGNHSSTVIGRRWNKGRCEYNIRNSWGSHCEAYNQNIECNEKDGSFWLKDEDFFEFSEAFHYLE